MIELAQQHCAPLPAGTPSLAADEVRALLPRIDPAWRVVDGQHLQRAYPLPDFATGLALVNQIGALAEAQDHHPDLLLAWGRVQITLWTHSVGGLSLNDFILAAQIDRLTP
ncbi:4a-hydroxytetrahydrobiopterin dehydratase [Immundisolibacter sp.]|uniref:4a-hydroxytetrahydrobiopterin dehydratase n=1 Tax=Immundisolibacter sp. TaxID=1934948 RepID=UPI0035697FD5